MRRLLTLTSALLAAAALGGHVVRAQEPSGQEGRITQGTLRALGAEGRPLGDCPLKHTDVEIDIAGHIARVVVTQKFTNPYADKIEAIYTFPLGANAAVGDMTMLIGERRIRGQIKAREEARRVYEQARAQGRIASLLDEERPNIFTQAVANIEPGVSIEIEISYTESLNYEDGNYAFVFPMVVGPRYIPAGSAPFVPAGFDGKDAVDAEPVPDAERITPPVTPEGTRAGHDIAVRVRLDAGMPIRSIASRQHEIVMRWDESDHTRALVELVQERVIPNKDFVLEFSTAAAEIQDALLTHTDERGGFFTLILQPPEKVQPRQIVPREIYFVIDTSGSQQGFPLEISKSIMRKAIRELRAQDEFNLITFAGSTRILWPEARANTAASREEALAFLENLRGGGGTEMMRAINTALGGKHDSEKLRIVAFFTDGYVGNDMQIINAVRKHAGTTRVFSFGIGTSVNRYLLDSMAVAGRGEVAYALTQQVGEKVALSFYDRINAPVLTDIEVDWGDLASLVEVDEIYPRMIPDLFSVKPVVLKGRYAPGRRDRTGEITLRGRTAAGAFERKLQVTLPGNNPSNSALAPLWARAKVEHLMNQDLLGIQRDRPDAAIKEEIVGLGLRYRLLTRFTSFVAVEERIITAGGRPRTVLVPVEMPAGVSYEGTFGTTSGGYSGGGAMVMQRSKKSQASGLMSLGSTGSWSAQPAFTAMDASEEHAGGDDRQTLKSAHERIEANQALSPTERKTQLTELKVVAELRGLAARLDRNGDYTCEQFTVRDGKLEVALYLYELDAATLAQLQQLGFVKLLEADAVKMVIGTIAVEQLEELVLLKEVRRITLAGFVG